MSYETILYAIDRRVLTISLKRPDRLNAFTTTMRDELIDAFQCADDDVRAIVITSAGPGIVPEVCSNWSCQR
jgi:enoyl-CoA hydratase/carnithine racemase